MANLVQPLKGGNFIHQEGPGSSCGSLLDHFSLKSKTAVVTGAGGGIGLSVAQAFAELGANVAIWYNSNESAHDRAGETSEKYGVKCKCRTFYPKHEIHFS
jgi:sorbose reductase